MTARAFLDTNILLYALVPASTFAHDPRIEIAESLLASGGAVSVQVLNEFCDAAHRKLGKSWNDIKELLGAVNVLFGPAVSLDSHVLTAALEISSRYRFRIYDSLILAAAEKAGCTTLYTEDLQHGQTIGNVKIVNPFL
jgi:predicted nucleic acid-binding protein